ncbi:complexin-3-like [Pseudophryne corroboree]|uniref:complexin-3-like n=1 Tax=Pseudophryne corroboree TaxID=495146 RepID=UPI00308158A5
MASVAKSLFGGPVKSMSCCTSGGFTQDLRPPREDKSSIFTTRRWSADEQQHRRVLQPDTKRRDSLYAQQKAERAVMREHFREKYNLRKNPQDQQQVKAAGDNVRLAKELRAAVRQGEPERDDFSLPGFLSYKSLDLSYLRKGANMEYLQPGRRCLVM